MVVNKIVVISLAVVGFLCILGHAIDFINAIIKSANKTNDSETM